MTDFHNRFNIIVKQLYKESHIDQNGRFIGTDLVIVGCNNKIGVKSYHIVSIEYENGRPKGFLEIQDALILLPEAAQKCIMYNINLF